jgi:hypothetical protein
MSDEIWQAGKSQVRRMPDGSFTLTIRAHMRGPGFTLSGFDLADLGLTVLAALRAREASGGASSGLLGLMSEVDDFLGGGGKGGG